MTRSLLNLIAPYLLKGELTQRPKGNPDPPPQSPGYDWLSRLIGATYPQDRRWLWVQIIASPCGDVSTYCRTGQETPR